MGELKGHYIINRSFMRIGVVIVKLRKSHIVIQNNAKLRRLYKKPRSLPFVSIGL